MSGLPPLSPPPCELLALGCYKVSACILAVEYIRNNCSLTRFFLEVIEIRLLHFTVNGSIGVRPYISHIIESTNVNCKA